MMAVIAVAQAATLPMFRGIDFDWTVNLGQVCIVGAFLFSIGVFVQSTRGQLKSVAEHLRENRQGHAALKAEVNDKFERLERNFTNRFEKLETILVKIAQQEARLDAHDKRIDGFDNRLASALDELGRLRTFGVQTNNRIIEGSRS